MEKVKVTAFMALDTEGGGIVAADAMPLICQGPDLLVLMRGMASMLSIDLDINIYEVEFEAVRKTKIDRISPKEAADAFIRHSQRHQGYDA